MNKIKDKKVHKLNKKEIQYNRIMQNSAYSLANWYSWIIISIILAPITIFIYIFLIIKKINKLKNIKKSTVIKLID